jgi:hypothetical protein
MSMQTKLTTKWFEDFAVVSEDGEIDDWPEVARKLIEHAEACKIDEAQLESAGEECERLNATIARQAGELAKWERDIADYREKWNAVALENQRQAWEIEQARADAAATRSYYFTVYAKGFAATAPLWHELADVTKQTYREHVAALRPVAAGEE